MGQVGRVPVTCTRNSAWARSRPVSGGAPALQGASQTVLVFYADMPLITQELMQALLALHGQNQAGGGAPPSPC